MMGYTDSQSWEAWLDSINVLWDNTELIFLASIILSIGAVIFTWFKYPWINLPKDPCYKPTSSPQCDVNVANEDDGYENEDKFQIEKNAESSLLDSNASTDVSSIHLSTKQLTKEIENQMSDDDKNKEMEARNQQLAAIFKMMKEQEDKFGDPSLEDIKKQMKFYCG